MARKTEITDFKTKRINKFTGGKIKTHSIVGYPKTKDDDGTLPNSFVAKDGTYIGDYGRAWWYFKNNMIVCNEHPVGVGIVLNKPASEIKDFDPNNINFENDVKSYYGYSHRGGNQFKIGDRLFDADYEPKESDYTKEEWKEFKAKREKSILSNLEDGWCKNREEAEKETSLRDVITFNKRGSKVIETWKEAMQSAINLSNDLS